MMHLNVYKEVGYLLPMELETDVIHFTKACLNSTFQKLSGQIIMQLKL